MIYDVDVSILYFVFCVCSINLLVQCSMLIVGVVHFFCQVLELIFNFETLHSLAGGKPLLEEDTA